MTNTITFDEFYAARAGVLVRAVYLATGDHGRAQDAVQEAFVRAWMRWDQLEHGDPTQWVYTVAWRMAIKDWRRGKRLENTLRRHGISDRAVDPPDPLTVDVQRALATVDAKSRSVLIMYYFADRSVHDIAMILDIPEGTVKARLHRSRASLARVLTSEGVVP